MCPGWPECAAAAGPKRACQGRLRWRPRCQCPVTSELASTRSFTGNFRVSGKLRTARPVRACVRACARVRASGRGRYRCVCVWFACRRRGVGAEGSARLHDHRASQVLIPSRPIPCMVHVHAPACACACAWHACAVARAAALRLLPGVPLSQDEPATTSRSTVPRRSSHYPILAACACARAWHGNGSHWLGNAPLSFSAHDPGSRGTPLRLLA